MLALYFRLLCFIAMMVTMTFSSCSDEEPTILIENSVLVSYSKIGNITTDNLRLYWDNPLANNFISNDVNVYKVNYESKDNLGQDIRLSGSILIPDIAVVKGIISIQHATFFADEEAPSENADFSVVSRKSIFASNGYIVFLPDYQGYGIDRDRIHPYHHAHTLASSTIDMISASKEALADLGIDTNIKLYLAGYSEGAYATAAVQQYLEEKNIDLNVSGLSIGSGAYNLKATFDSFVNKLDFQDFSCLPCNAFFIQSYNELYNFNQPMTYYFQEPYAQLIDEGLLLGKKNATEIAEKLTDKPEELFQTSFLTDYMNGLNEWNKALIENSIQDWLIPVPTLITHNIEDHVAPFFNGENLAELNATNPSVVFESIPNTNHFDGIFVWGIMTMDYFNGL